MAQVIEIHDFSDPALDVYARATENQLVNRPTRPTPCSSPRAHWSSAVRWTPGAYRCRS